MSEVKENKNLAVLGEEITTIPLVIEKDGLSIANVSLIKKYVSELKVEAEDKKVNELDLGNLISYYDKIKEVRTNFGTYRKGQLQPLKDIPSAFTSIENKEWKEIVDSVHDEVERRKESVYILADANITTVLNELLEVESEKVRSRFDRRVLDKDLSGTRTNVTAQLSVLSEQKEDESDEKYEARKAKFVPKIQAPLRTAVQKLLERELKPIREAVALEELEETETKRFDVAINSLKINSNDIKSLKDILLDLAKQSETVEELYPNIYEYCTTRLRNTYSQVKSNIKALESEAKRVEAEAKTKALKDADLPILEKANDISNNIDANSQNKEWLDRQLQALNGLLEQLSFKENIQTISNIKERIFTKLSLLVTDELDEESNPFEEEVTEIAKEVIEEPTIYEVDFRVNTTLDKVKLLKAYALSIGVELKSI